MQYKTLHEELYATKQENKQLKEQLNKSDHVKATLFDNNEILKNDYKNKIDYIEQLKLELFNAYLKQQHDTKLIAELKEALSSYNNFVDVMFPE